jgi:hypothetical protein
MELKIDFNEVPKSKYRYYLGFVMLFFSIILFIYSIYTLSLFFILYFFFFSVMSFSHIYESGGKSINSIFGERFLKIDEEKVEFKDKTLKQSTTIYRDNIDSIKFATTKILINSKDDSKIEIEYGKLNYTKVQQLKEKLEIFGKEKMIL